MSCCEPPSITVSRRGSNPADKDALHTVIWMGGEHDLATKPSIVVAIARAAERDAADLIVDLSGVTFMDASTVGALLDSRNRLRVRSQSLEVRTPSPIARRVLELCGAVHLVHSETLEVVRPAGVAGALSTWVEVPSTQMMRPLDHDLDSVTLGVDRRGS